MPATRRPQLRRWNALPALVRDAPPRVLLIVGVVVVVLGALILSRPLTSLVLLGVYVGASAVVMGILELVGRPASWWARSVSAAWIIAGIAVLVWLGRSLELLPPVLAVLLVIGGLASIGRAVSRGGVSARVLALSWGVAQVAFGVLSFTWPDVTVLVLAVVFGVRTIVFGLGVLGRGVAGIRRPRPRTEPFDAQRAVRRRRVRAGWAAAGRYALSLVLVATAAGGWWLNDWLDAGAPVVDAFYDPPAQVPSGHGRLIRSDAYLGRLPENGDVSRILYTTRDAENRPAVASALVIVPKDPPAGPRPVIVWNHGTTGVAQGCAPSLRDASATKWSIPALEQALKAGWVVVASDFSGQGAPGAYPYLIGEGEARSSLDAVLATSELRTDLTLSPDTVVWGHSQGGHAALWTTAIAKDYAPGLDVLGTAVVAPVADPPALARELLSGPPNAMLSVITSWVLVPYSETYADVHLDDYIAEGSRSIVLEMTQRCPSEPGVVVSVLTALGVSEDRPLYSADLTSGALGRRLAENAMTAPLGTPMLVAWGADDEVIPPTLQRDYVQKLCAEGQPVRWATYAGYDHLRPILPKSRFLPVLYTWTKNLIDRTDQVVNGCGLR
ncbi:alpha/beta fold hydrolase [Microbacterium hydrothermale]|uniref:alpha/beta fold hydrolase n=1 Tax=Microbacterium hydrothermale TaxID=857427 RepID=UPI0010A8415D|nr:alpha/beta fold hydrolase [Microbacterium hydrothermale]